MRSAKRYRWKQKSLKSLEKGKNRRKLGRLLDCSSRKKADDSKNQKESILQVKRKTICFLQEYVESRKYNGMYR